MSKDWNEFNRFEDVDEKYLPARGEGDTVATQITTAVSKLVYKWFNDGDTYDNTHWLEGWCNDLSSYANWLYMNVEETRPILSKIEKVASYGDYEDLLYELCETVQTMEFLKEKEVDKVGTVYDCKGPFRFVDKEDDEWY